MYLPNDIKIYGNTEYRGACPKEALEQVTFFARLRRQYPDTLGLIGVHVRNEGKRNLLQAAKEKSEGMTTGAADIIIPGAPTFICELKRRDHTASSISTRHASERIRESFSGVSTTRASGSPFSNKSTSRKRRSASSVRSIWLPVANSSAVFCAVKVP